MAACSAFPQDAEGTLERVRRDHVFRVGVIASGAGTVAPGEARLFLSKVAAATGARPQLRAGASEPLLLDLADGRLDIVLGPLADATPWKNAVAVLRPLQDSGASGPHPVLAAAARNGENAWVMLLERAVRPAAPRG